MTVKIYFIRGHYCVINLPKKVPRTNTPSTQKRTNNPSTHGKVFVEPTHKQPVNTKRSFLPSFFSKRDRVSPKNAFLF